MKKFLLVVLSVFSVNVFAGGWATPAVPTGVDIVRGEGFMVYGAFGNPGECSAWGKFFVKIDHPQYSEIYSAVLAAYMSGKKVKPYIHGCTSLGWYAVSSTTFNILSSNGALNIQND